MALVTTLLPTFWHLLLTTQELLGHGPRSPFPPTDGAEPCSKVAASARTPFHHQQQPFQLSSRQLFTGPLLDVTEHLILSRPDSFSRAVYPEEPGSNFKIDPVLFLTRSFHELPWSGIIATAPRGGSRCFCSSPKWPSKWRLAPRSA